MHLTPNRDHRFRLTQASLFLLALVLTCVGIAGLATTGAKAAPVSLTFDNGQISAGAFRQVKILPATSTFPSDSLPLPQRTDIQLIGDETNGQLNFPAASNTGLQFPYMNLPHPLEDLRIPITMRLNEPGLTGTYDAATGAASLKGSVDIIVITGTGTSFPVPDGLSDVGVPPLNLFARCRVNDVPVEFNTEDKFPFNGAPFKGGFGVNGAMSTKWIDLPYSESENGGDCNLLAIFTSSSGGIWLSNGVVEPTPQPPAPDPTCETDFNLCPDPEVSIASVALSPKKRTVKAGKRTKLKVQVVNDGPVDADALRVELKSSNRKVKLPKAVTMDVASDSTATRTITVRATRKAKGKAKITANGAGLKATATVKIKKAKTKKRRGR